MRTQYAKRISVPTFHDRLYLSGFEHLDTIVAMDDWFPPLRKAELHLHLEGSLEPETLCELDPRLGMDEARARYAVTDFAGFIDAFKWAVGYLNSPDDYALATRRLLERLHRENIVQAEITLAAGVVLWRKLDFPAIYDAVASEAARSPVRVRWVLDAIRHFGVGHAMEVAKLAVERKGGGGVGAFGVGGDESRGPTEWFADVFAFAKSQGLALVPHAGETAGPGSVWAAVRLNADRIGHGIRAIDDPALVRHLAERMIPLEVCITSNVATGAVRSLAEHPVLRLHRAGVPIILNTDDPAIFSTTLAGEFAVAERMGFTRSELEGLVANAFRFAI